ncbi:prolyl oligopeptidase family serine peptidase [Fulvivirgaceae bacterium BMA12]|uniref:Prolyl oligopeptidase family serine peptidase n=1 Tax=Agaribacillus aureus TaxID=3051825 RepID=A0ABT8L241_9BACT|nr:prolyl oligopeptidase family serine peptidase [Fulvivirgaceae bacterium BMA12]
MRFTILVFAYFLSSLVAFGQQSGEKFTMEMDYLLYLPDDYTRDTTQQWPLLIFLHGGGEQGTDLEKVKKHGPPMLVEKGEKFPFLIVSPQARRGWQPEFLYAMIKAVIKENRVDEDRVYLTGLSMGGFGTWALAQKHRELFAAIVPICGGGDTDEIWKLQHMPVWCFHGARDKVVPLGSSQNMVDALKVYNPDVKFTIYADVGHDSWTQAYNDPHLYEWLLRQKKFKLQEVSIDKKLLNEYAGDYLLKTDNFERTLKIFVEENKLIVQVGENKVPLKPASNFVFFIENQLTELHFLRNSDGKVDRIKIYDDKIQVFQKIK